MLAHQIRHWAPVKRLADNPDRAQENVLRKILAANQTSEFGVQHRFEETSTAGVFRERVEVQDYESLRSYVDRQRHTAAPALTTEPPLFYAQTSGSTGQPKYIPVTSSMLRMHRDEQALFACLQYRACPEAFSGQALGIMGAAVEGRLESGHDVGSVSGYLYESLPGFVRSRFVVPPAVSRIADYDLKYLVILRLALAAPDITYLGSPNPSTFLRLLDILNGRREELARSLETGQLPELETVEEPVRRVVLPQLRVDRARARQLRGAGAPTFASLWPRIRLLTTWTGGSCGIALDKLRKTLPQQAMVMELGYQSTECRGTIALEPETPGGLPPLHHHFFEFVTQADWDNGRRHFVGLGELVPDTRYYIAITTAAGLYRYFMNDLVEVTGRFANTPLLRFVQKGKGVTSLTGEKVYENQVIEAVQDASRRHDLTPEFFVLVANEESPSYSLYIECDERAAFDTGQLAADVDARLGDLNQEYYGKRASGRLAPLTADRIRIGAAQDYKAACVRRGQREGQYKPAVLQYRRELPLSLQSYVVR